MTTLKRRLVLTYSLLMAIALLALIVAIGHLSNKMFTAMVGKINQQRIAEINRTIVEQYDDGDFDLTFLRALLMPYVHYGYIVNVENRDGESIWSARECEMEQCQLVIKEITDRMRQYHVGGELQATRYPLTAGDEIIGYANIETYNPFFFSREESAFLSALNRSLCVVGVILIAACAGISILLATEITRPIKQVIAAAQMIADGNFSARVAAFGRVRELRDLAEAINHLAEELMRGEQQQKQLLADVAHELRTPLTCLQGSVEAMQDGIFDPTPERLADCNDEIKRLNSLVEDLSQLTLLESDKLVLQPAPFAFDKMLDSVAQQFSAAAAKKQIALRVDLSPQIFIGDENRLRQVFINLCANAVKYTERGEITIALKCAEKVTGFSLLATVSDTGVGIRDEDLPHLFERFFRADHSRSRRTGGAGIGLTIAEKIITRHHGKITVNSELNRGTAFHVWL